MLLANYSFPVLRVFWDIFIFFAWVVFIWLLILVYMDLFRRDDISGWGKAGWVIFTIVLPVIGVLAYLIAYGKGMERRNVSDSLRWKKQTDNYIRSVTSSSSSDGTDEIAKAHALLEQGAITPDEYEELKRRALAGSPQAASSQPTSPQAPSPQ